jgi:hypothetical protein
LYVAFFTCIAAPLFERFGLFPGRGGRLGTGAFIGSVLALVIISAIEMRHQEAWTQFHDPNVVSYGYLDDSMIGNIFFCNLLGVIATCIMRLIRPFVSPVVMGNAVSLVLICIMDSFFPYTLSSHFLDESAGCILQGAFVGMSSFAILTNWQSVVFLGILSGCYTLLLYPVFPYGVGGKRGFMAFLAVHTFLGLTIVYQRIIAMFVKPISSANTDTGLALRDSLVSTTQSPIVTTRKQSENLQSEQQEQSQKESA